MMLKKIENKHHKTLKMDRTRARGKSTGLRKLNKDKQDRNRIKMETKQVYTLSKILVQDFSETFVFTLLYK